MRVYRVLARLFTGRSQARIMTQVNRRREPTTSPAAHSLRAGALAVAALALFAAGCSASSPRTASSNSVVAHDSSGPSSSPSTPAPLPAGVLSQVEVDAGAAPLGVGAGYGSVWINAHRAADLYRVNPKTDKIMATVPVDDCCLIPVAGAGHIWAGATVIDPATNRIVGSLPGSVLGAFIVVDGTPWAYTADGLASIDPKTYRPSRRFKVNANPRKVSDPDIEAAYGDGAFWVIVVGDSTQTFGGAVIKVDPRTGETLHTYHPPDPGGYADIQFLDHAIWLKGDDSGRLVKLSTRTGASHVYRLPGWRALTSSYTQTIALGDGDLWIRNSTSKIVRFRPGTGRVIGVYPGSPTAGGGFYAVAFGSLWVANFDDDTVWRDRVTK